VGPLEEVVNRPGQLMSRNPQGIGEVGLGVQIDEQDLLSFLFQAGGDVQGAGRFPDTSFLIA